MSELRKRTADDSCAPLTRQTPVIEGLVPKDTSFHSAYEWSSTQARVLRQMYTLDVPRLKAGSLLLAGIGRLGSIKYHVKMTSFPSCRNQTAWSRRPLFMQKSLVQLEMLASSPGCIRDRVITSFRAYHEQKSINI